MGLNTKIPYCDATWDIIEGCSPVSRGCNACWAKRLAPRLGVKWGAPVFRPDRLAEPLRRRQPTVYFVASRSDLFHERIGLEVIAEAFDIMASATADCGKNHKHEEECWCGASHTFLLLTKRPAWAKARIEALPDYVSERWSGDSCLSTMLNSGDGPLLNVWLGVSVEDQETADERIPILLTIPAAHRWVSVEPALSMVYAANWRGRGAVDRLVWGCESGPNRRPAPWDWEEGARLDCEHHGVPYYCKQLAENPDGSGRVIHYPPREETIGGLFGG